MLSIVQDIPDFALSSELDNFVIGSDKTVTFTLKKGSAAIFQETYVPDAQNRIAILDLSSLIEPQLVAPVLQQFSYSCTASAETEITKTFTVLLSCYLVPATATEFVDNYFLTALAGRDKITALGRSETLYLTTGAMVSGGTTIPVTAECVFVNDNNNLAVSTRSLGSVPDYGMRWVDVSPSRFTLSGYKLLRYTVIAGARRQTFRLDHAQPEAIAFKFRNAFGVMDTLYFVGGDKVEPELTRSAAYFSGLYKTYHVDEQRRHTVCTGYLPESMHRLADDLARATEVYLIDGSREIPVTIVESDTARNDADDGLFAFTVTYILSSRCQRRLELLPDIFDDSFDDTYN